jgi:hypothetical protein
LGHDREREEAPRRSWEDPAKHQTGKIEPRITRIKRDPLIRKHLKGLMVSVERLRRELRAES